MTPHTFNAGLSLDRLADFIRNLLSWIDHPAPETLTTDWLDAIRDDLRGKVLAARNATGEEHRSLIRDAERLSLDLAALLHSRPEITRVPFDRWGPHMPSQLVGELRDVEFRLHRLGAELMAEAEIVPTASDQTAGPPASPDKSAPPTAPPPTPPVKWAFAVGQFWYNGNRFDLAGNQLRLLKTLAEAPDQTREAYKLEEAIWGDEIADGDIDARKLRDLVSELRKSLRQLLQLPANINPVRNVKQAYRLEI